MDYRPLVRYCQDLGQGLEEAVLPLAWRIVNDSFRTDVSLLFPPFLIALSCLHMASAILAISVKNNSLCPTSKNTVVFSRKDLRAWFADLAFDMDKIQETTKHILALYDLWKGYDEKKEINSILQKMIKPILKQN